jgi:hypothetical protein
MIKYNIYHISKEIGENNNNNIEYKKELKLSNYFPDNYIHPINNFLLEHNNEDLFVLCPGYGLNKDIQFGITGKAYYEESSYDAAVRECLEETGLIYMQSYQSINLDKLNSNDISKNNDKITNKKKTTQYFFFQGRNLKAYNIKYHKYLLNKDIIKKKDDLSKRVAVFIYGTYRELLYLLQQLDNRTKLNDGIKRLLIIPFKLLYQNVKKDKTKKTDKSNIHWRDSGRQLTNQ